MPSQTRLLWYVLLIAALGLFIVIAYLPGRDVPGDIITSNATNGTENTNQVVNTNTSANTNSETVLRSGNGDLEMNQPIVVKSGASWQVTVSGRVRAFENTVGIIVSNNVGETIFQSSAIATGELGELNPFEKTITLTDPNTNAITTYVASARDGSITDELSFVVELE